MSEHIKVLVGVSGGVDSAYSLALLKKKGYDVCAAFLIMNDESDGKAAKITAAELGVPYVEIDCRKDFESIVIANFTNEYAQGRTPNPCVVCNRFVKIEALVRYAEENGFDKVATGHYADVKYNNYTDRFELYMGKDISKDQSYMLWRLTQRQLSKLILPLANDEKIEVRKNSSALGLSSADKKDSLDICFIPNGDYATFLARQKVILPEGEFVHADGRKLGKSKSIINYTIGQRRGLDLAMDRSVYVTDIIADKNTIVVDYEEGIYSQSFLVSDVNSVSTNSIPGEAFVKIRYAAKPVLCTITPENDGKYRISASALPFRAVTPGQSAVFYDSDSRLLFGGYITKKG